MASMAGMALVTQPELGWPLATFMVGIVFMMGVSTMWVIGKQAAVDSAVRGFAMLGQTVGIAGSKVKAMHGFAERIIPSPDADSER